MLLAGISLLAAGLAEATPLWTDGAMPDFQPHQTSKSYLQWHETPTRNRTGQCVILISGGGYTELCDGIWVGRFADYLTARGVQCVSLTYRIPRPRELPIYQTAWEDGQRAVRIVRREARKRGYEPEMIGALGFSAGAHLTLLLATSSETPAYPRVDETDDIPCHVNFAVPIFPAYVLSDGLEGPNRTKGDAPDVTLNPCFKFDSRTCPMCLIHGSDDIYSSLGSVLIYKRLHAMGVSSDLHIYADRGHGFMSDNALLRVLDAWIDRVGDFLKNREVSAKAGKTRRTK